MKFISSKPLVAMGAAFAAGLIVMGALWATVGSLSASREQTTASDVDPTPPSPDADSTPQPSPSPSSTARPSADRPSVATASTECADATVEVSTAEELETALEEVEPGDVIGMADGTYTGNFVASASGEEDAPISLCGTSDAVLDGGDYSDGYVLHLDHAQYWRLIGFTVSNGQKGVMADGTVGSVIAGLTVSSIGDEAVHLRNFSTDNLVEGNTISDTGKRKPKFGEGIYIGTAESNWCDISDCEPDNSDRNVVSGNDIFATTSESIDIKEGTSAGIVRGNTFDGSSLDGDPDSWVDVKGNGWLIEDNVGVNSTMDGFQTHEILDGWGTGNIFRGNTAEVNGPGFGFSLTPELENVVDCDNTVRSAGEGMYNVDCSG